MEMEMQGVVEDVTKSELLGLNSLMTWNQQRTTDQLLNFIARREAAIADAMDD
jgi:hypothetical protein